MQKSIYPFMKAVQGNWRNAIYITCNANCIACPEFLLAIDRAFSPLLVEVSTFQEITGEQIDKEECASILTRQAFDAIFAQWLLWEIDDPTRCSLLQLVEKQT